MKIAVVHDWLIKYAGSERVLEQILLIYPDSDLFSVVDFIDKDKRGFILNKNVSTTFIQSLPILGLKPLIQNLHLNFPFKYWAIWW
jgi:hypothetical protein